MGWYERWAQWSERYRFVMDLGATLLAALAVVPGAVVTFAGQYPARWIVLASLLVLAPLPWARTRPFASATAVFVLAMAQLAIFDIPFLPADLGVIVSVYCVTVYGSRRAYLAACGMAVFGSVAFGLSMTFTIHSLISIIPTLAILAASFAFGLVRRSRRVMLLAMRDRAERLEVERDQQAQIATAAERARIAREMHDIVAHSLSVIIAQADGGRYAAAADPAAAQRSLGTIAETGRAALADMRRLLGVLRDDQPSATTPLGLVAPDDTPGRAGAPGGGTGRAGAGRSGTGAVAPGGRAGAGAAGRPSPAGPGTTGPGTAGSPGAGNPGAAAPLRPQPDATDIGQLVEQARDGGMRVSWARVGVERRLPPGVGLTLYRVCQESLTNVRKHAGPRPAVTVLVRWGEEEVELRVDDDGRGLAADGPGDPAEPAPAPGYGLLGMRERAEMFGGTLSAGPRRGGGFSVRFVVPIPRASVNTLTETAGTGPAEPPATRSGRPTEPAEPAGPAGPDLPATEPADHTTNPEPADLHDTRGAR